MGMGMGMGMGTAIIALRTMPVRVGCSLRS
jgi:hypothetical protein